MRFLVTAFLGMTVEKRCYSYTHPVILSVAKNPIKGRPHKRRGSSFMGFLVTTFLGMTAGR